MLRVTASSRADGKDDVLVGRANGGGRDRERESDWRRCEGSWAWPLGR